MDATIESAIGTMALALPGCPRPLLISSLEKAVKGFMRFTHAITCQLTSITTVDSTSEYTVSLPSGWDGYAVFEIISVYLDGDEITTPRDWYYDDGTITLRSIPDSDTEGKDLDITVAVVLDDIQDDDLTLDCLGTWLDPGIVGKATYDIAILPKRPWTNGDVAALKLREYNEAVTDALYRTGGDTLQL